MKIYKKGEWVYEKRKNREKNRLGNTGTIDAGV